MKGNDGKQIYERDQDTGEVHPYSVEHSVQLSARVGDHLLYGGNEKGTSYPIDRTKKEEKKLADFPGAYLDCLLADDKGYYPFFMNMEGKEPVSQVAFLDSRFQEQQRLPLDSFGHHTFQGLLDSQSLYMIMDKEGGGKSLLVIDRKSGEMEDVPFTQREISGLLDRGDQLLLLNSNPRSESSPSQLLEWDKKTKKITRSIDFPGHISLLQGEGEDLYALAVVNGQSLLMHFQWKGDQLQIQSKQGVSIPEGSYASLLFVNKNATPAK